MDGTQGFNASALSEQLLTLLRDPTSNLTAALILYGMIGVAILIVLVGGLALLLGTSDEDEELADPEAPSSSTSIDESDAVEDVARVASTGESPPSRPVGGPILLTAAVVLGVLAAVWAVAGFTTSSSEVCTACHVSTVHSQVKGGNARDPHSSVPCTSCHESGGLMGRLTSGVPSRALHFLSGGTGFTPQTAYGRVGSSTCSSCHSKDIAGVSLNAETGVRMSHAEPLAASATCLDCHKPRRGVVSNQTVGMRSCLRCHDGEAASSRCDTCHDKKTAAAARARTTSLAKSQVSEVRCGGCHDQAKECDTCHGVRMPHTVAFKAGAHARAGAVDFWYNGGRTCSKCHTATRRPCTKCHSSQLGRAHPNQGLTHQAAVSSSCNRCHIVLANPRDRDFCRDVCHTEAAKAESPR